MYPVDMHCHTTRSDGRNTPAELLRRAGQLGIKILVICDHDTLPPDTVVDGGKEYYAADYACSQRVRLIKGIEFSCDTDNEDVHIVAVGCDWNNSWFSGYEIFVKKSKLEGYQKVIEALNRNGFPLTLNEVLENSGNAKASENLQKKHIFEVMTIKGYAKSWYDAKMMVQTTAGLNYKRKKPNPIDVIKAIHSSGGFTILAHPYLIDETVTYCGRIMSRHEYILNLVENGLDGIEARYTYDKTSYKGSLTKQQIYAEITSRYHLPIISGGSDYHADYKIGLQKCRELGEAGLTEPEFYDNPLLLSLLT